MAETRWTQIQWAVSPRSRRGPAGALAGLAEQIAQPQLEPARWASQVRAWRADGLLDEVQMYAALAAIAIHPSVRDYREASRCIALQEVAVLSGSGDVKDLLAAVERHRGVLACCMGRPSIALECFTRAVTLDRTPQNMANVLAVLLLLGDVTEAKQLLAEVRRGFPPAFRVGLDVLVATDDGLLLLR